MLRRTGPQCKSCFCDGGVDFPFVHLFPLAAHRPHHPFLNGTAETKRDSDRRVARGPRPAGRATATARRSGLKERRKRQRRTDGRTAGGKEIGKRARGESSVGSGLALERRRPNKQAGGRRSPRVKVSDANGRRGGAKKPRK